MVRIILTALVAFYISFGKAQINNLQHEKGYQTASYGSLGNVQEFGNGAKPLIMISGWGFDNKVFENFITSEKDKYKMYVITLPGFGNSQAPPMPMDNEKYSDLYWTNGIIAGVKKLIEDKAMIKPMLMSYFTYSNIIVMRMAIDYPELIDKAIIISGMAKFTSNYPSYEPANLAQRVYYVENILSKQWFKTVDKSTWDNGNFTPEIFTSDSVKAQKYWNQMSSVSIPVMVRYLCEYYCTDLSLEYSKLRVPTLVIMPSFKPEILTNPKNSYLTPFFHHSWWGAKPASQNIQLVTITDTNTFIFDDQPKKVIGVIDSFVNGSLTPFDVIR